LTGGATVSLGIKNIGCEAAMYISSRISKSIEINKLFSNNLSIQIQYNANTTQKI
jgi:hypothetical protein